MRVGSGRKRETRGESPAMANTFVGRGADSDDNVSPQLRGQDATPIRALLKSVCSVIFVSSLAFANMFVEKCGIACLLLIPFLGCYLVCYQTKPLQTGYREASGTYIARRGEVNRYGLNSCRMSDCRAEEAISKFLYWRFEIHPLEPAPSHGEDKRCVRLH
jgi:hypothetical protein